MSSELLFSPLDNRYRSVLPRTLSESFLLECQVEVEKAWLLTLMDEGLAPNTPEKKVDAAWKGLSFEEIEKIEKTTQHATRALVEALSLRLKKNKMSKLANWVHVGLTSFDTVDTAQRLRLKAYIEGDFLSLLSQFKAKLRDYALRYEDTLQCGRTHGQWAVPTLFGLSFAEAHHRLSELEKRLDYDLKDLRGQASGAIGGYHASSFLVSDPLKMEEDYLNRLGLKPHLGSLQILPPEDIFALASTVFSMASVVAKIAEDLRHLARSEIAEISEGLRKGQVGSSTMPQKRNPWNLEHVCSLYKVLQSRLQLIQIDLVTEHQRDLTNSASGRFYSEFFAIAHLMFHRLDKVLENLEVHADHMREHLEKAGASVYAEAFYILATKQGVEDAHSVVREASRESEKTSKSLLEILKSKKVLPKDFNMDSLKRDSLRGSFMKMASLKSEWEL